MKKLKKIEGNQKSDLEKTALEFSDKFYEKNKEIINASENFPLFIRRQTLSYFLAKYELYKKTLDIKGSIIECGSFQGSSLLFFAKLTSIFEPYQINKKRL